MNPRNLAQCSHIFRLAFQHRGPERQRLTIVSQSLRNIAQIRDDRVPFHVADLHVPLGEFLLKRIF